MFEKIFSIKNNNMIFIMKEHKGNLLPDTMSTKEIRPEHI